MTPRYNVQIFYNMMRGSTRTLYYHAKAVEVSLDIVHQYGTSWSADLVELRQGTIIPTFEIRIKRYNGHLETIREVFEVHQIEKALRRDDT